MHGNRMLAGRIARLLSSHEVLRYGVVGVAATGIHLGVYYLLLWPGVNYNLAYAAGCAVSLVFNFYASNLYTFRTRPTVSGALKFAGSHGVNFLLHLLLLNLYVAIGVSERLAPVFIYVIAIPVTFLLVRRSLKGSSKNKRV